MKSIAIDLRAPFETVVATALQLPPGAVGDAAVIKAVRRLYDAAHGRSVQTSIGLIPIAPAVAASLADEPLYVSTRAALLKLLKRPIRLARTGKQNFRRYASFRRPRRWFNRGPVALDTDSSSTFRQRTSTGPTWRASVGTRKPLGPAAKK